MRGRPSLGSGRSTKKTDRRPLLECPTRARSSRWLPGVPGSAGSLAIGFPHSALPASSFVRPNRGIDERPPEPVQLEACADLASVGGLPLALGQLRGAAGRLRGQLEAPRCGIGGRQGIEDPEFSGSRAAGSINRIAPSGSRKVGSGHVARVQARLFAASR